MTEIERLAKAIKDLHGVKAEHQHSAPVHETFEGKTAWNGVVEVFQVRGHLTATFAYAWSYKDDNGKLRYVAVLGIPPVNSAEDAVRAYIVSQVVKNSP